MWFSTKSLENCPKVRFFGFPRIWSKTTYVYSSDIYICMSFDRVHRTASNELSLSVAQVVQQIVMEKTFLMDFLYGEKPRFLPLFLLVGLYKRSKCTSG